MDLKLYSDIKKYLENGTFPTTFTSNKSNFISIASKYTLNKKQMLLRNDKPVVTEKMQDEIFDALHNHSGRSNTWSRINER